MTSTPDTTTHKIIGVVGSPLYLSVVRCTEKSVLIRIFEMIRIFIRKSANNTEMQR